MVLNGTNRAIPINRVGRYPVRKGVQEAFRVTKSELIKIITQKLDQLPTKDVELAVNIIIDLMSRTLAEGRRIEIRGFGSFSLHHRKAYLGRNPKTGEDVPLSERSVPHFKPGREMRERVNQTNFRVRG